MFYHWQKFTILLGELVFLVIIVKTEIRNDSFSSNCSVVRRFNSRTSYQVELGRNGYTEFCVLAYVGINSIPVCAYVVNFHLACNWDKRLVLVLQRENGFNYKEFDCKTGKPTKAYCGKYVYMYLKHGHPIHYNDTDNNGSYLLINVELKTETAKVSDEINYVEIVVPFSCGILVLLTIIAIVWNIRAKKRKMRLRSTNIINLSQQSTGLSQSNSLGRNSQVHIRYYAVPNQYVDLETIPRQQSQSHTPNHETDINTLQTVNQRPSQFNTTEMNHGNHGAVIQNSSDSLISSGNQGNQYVVFGSSIIHGSINTPSRENREDDSSMSYYQPSDSNVVIDNQGLITNDPGLPSQYCQLVVEEGHENL